MKKLVWTSSDNVTYQASFGNLTYYIFKFPFGATLAIIGLQMENWFQFKSFEEAVRFVENLAQ